jgi:hypothetical protein
MFDPKPHLIQLSRRAKDPQTGQWTTRLEDYLEVKWRLVWFRERYPHGTITTKAILLDWPQGIAIIRATVADGEGGSATGTGTETCKGFEDFVEKAETRAVGRALAALGIGTQFVGEELSDRGRARRRCPGGTVDERAQRAYRCDHGRPGAATPSRGERSPYPGPGPGAEETGPDRLRLCRG